MQRTIKTWALLLSVMILGMVFVPANFAKAAEKSYSNYIEAYLDIIQNHQDAYLDYILPISHPNWDMDNFHFADGVGLADICGDSTPELCRWYWSGGDNPSLYIWTFDGERAKGLLVGNSAHSGREFLLTDNEELWLYTMYTMGDYIHWYHDYERWTFTNGQLQPLNGSGALSGVSFMSLYEPSPMEEYIGPFYEDGKEITKAQYEAKVNNLRSRTTSKLGSSFSEAEIIAYLNTLVIVYLDGKQIPMATAPIVDNGRTMVPFRGIFEALGLKVDWDANTKTVTGTKEGKTIQLMIGDKTAVVDGQNQTLDAVPMISNGATLVPLRFVAEASGLEVKWDGAERQVLITTPSN